MTLMKKTRSEKFRARARLLLKKKGLTSADVAEALGIAGAGNARQILCGIHLPPVAKAKALAALLGTTTAKLFGPDVYACDVRGEKAA